MTRQEFFTTLGYLANPIRQTLIEIELPSKDRLRFENDYATRTRRHPLPQDTTTSPYYVWPPGADKWGIEARMYFVSNDNSPQALLSILEPRRVQNRPGYDNWQRRCSTKDFIYQLFEHGFIIGTPQNEHRIRGFIHNPFINDFNIGFNL